MLNLSRQFRVAAKATLGLSRGLNLRLGFLLGRRRDGRARRRHPTGEHHLTHVIHRLLGLRAQRPTQSLLGVKELIRQLEVSRRPLPRAGYSRGKSTLAAMRSAQSRPSLTSVSSNSRPPVDRCGPVPEGHTNCAAIIGFGVNGLDPPPSVMNRRGTSSRMPRKTPVSRSGIRARATISRSGNARR